jgi:hypothetical protein
VAAAELDYISCVFAHNAAKLSLARALGSAADIRSDDASKASSRTHTLKT